MTTRRRTALKAALAEQDIRHYELADRLKISEWVLANIIAGRRVPSVELQEQIAGAVGRPVEELFGDG